MFRKAFRSAIIPAIAAAVAIGAAVTLVSIILFIKGEFELKKIFFLYVYCVIYVPIGIFFLFFLSSIFAKWWHSRN